MRKAFLLATGILIPVAVIYMVSCKKSDSKNAGGKSMIEKVTSWLEGQKTAGKELKNQKIQNLMDHLDFSKMYYEPFNKEKQFIIVPVNSGYKSKNNSDKDPVNNLLLVADNFGNIVKGNIAQFIPADRQKDKTVPRNTFNKIFNSRTLDCDGRFAFLSVNDWLIYELTYEKGRVRSYGVTKRKDPPASAARTNTSECFAVYLVTTSYYPDGSVTVEEDYQYTYCVCVWGTLCDELVEGNGGSDECCIPDPDIQYTTSNIPEPIGLQCGQVTVDRFGNESKSCTFSWYFNTNSILYYSWKSKSVENCQLQKVNGTWKFKPGSVSHGQIALEGQLPPCVSFNCNITSAIGSVSADGLTAQMTLQYTNSFRINCCPYCTPSYENYSSTVVWTPA